MPSRPYLSILGSPLLGFTLGLVLAGPSGPALGQDRGDGQTSTRLSQPPSAEGLQPDRSIPPDETLDRPGGVEDFGRQRGTELTPGTRMPELGDVPGGRGQPGEGLPADRPPTGALGPPGRGPVMPDDLPSALDPMFRGDGADVLSDRQLESLQQSEERLLPAARAIPDPGERSLALTRIARSKIRSRRYDEAREALDEAARASQALPPGLARDLRLMSVARTYADLAHDRIIEAVPTIAPVIVVPEGRQDPGEDRSDWLEEALEEFARAAAVVRDMHNPHYRSEHLALLVQAQAIDGMKIARDAARPASGRLDSQFGAGRLLGFGDRLLVQAARQAEAIDLGVWRDESLIIITICAARSNQFTRALSIARSIGRPAPRAEALMQTAERLARLAAIFHTQYERRISRSWQDLASRYEQVASLPTPSETQPADISTTILRQDLIRNLLFRVEDHVQLARALRSLADLLREAMEQNESTRGALPSPLSDPQKLIVDVRELSQAATKLETALGSLRQQLMDRQEAARGLDLQQQDLALSQAFPAADDPRLAEVRQRNQEVLDLLRALGQPLDDAATPIYEESARAITAVRDVDPRANTTDLLIESLISVGRFPDARLASAMLADEERRHSALARIAESQGRRGLAEEARAWIAREVPPQRQSSLLRRVEEGTLTSLDQLRIRAAGGSSAIEFDSGL